jgi:hypothetical protein
MKLNTFGILMAVMFALVQVNAQAGTQSLDVGVWDGDGCCGSSTRGYWFEAPIDFTIVGVSVPTSGPGDGATLEVVRFDAVPPEFSNTTNGFTQLGFWSGVTSTTADIEVSAGDIIGVLGWADGRSPYRNADGPYASTLGGESVTLTRLGFQSRGEAADLFSEESGPIATIGLEYTVGPRAPEVVVPVPTMNVWALLLLAALMLLVTAVWRSRTAAN